MKNFVFLSVFLVPYLIVSASDHYPRQTGIDILHYEFTLRINDTTDIIEGRTLIDMILKSKNEHIDLDLKGSDGKGKGMAVTRVSSGGINLNWKQAEDKLKIDLGSAAASDDTVELEVIYHGIPADGLIISRNKYGDRTFFADHWPDRAHNYLPCIDHPYDKATVDFIIISPDYYSVVSNGLMIEESAMEGSAKLTHWREKVPLPVKVMTFGAARFAVSYAGDAGKVPVWSWVFPQNRKEGFNDYAVAVKPLDYYSSIIGEYPFEKLADVQSKTIYGGLENAGAIFYSENSVTGQGKAERLIAHEVAHQWFGDCVTEADWHHIWLSEGFATYLTSMYTESTQGKARLSQDMAQTRELILTDFRKHSGPVIDTTITNLLELLSVNSYQKGAWILHMLRSITGNEAFIKGLGMYYEKFKNSNALTVDFQHVMEQVSGRDLSSFFSQWLYTPGQPELKITRKPGRKKDTTDISIDQKQSNLFEFNIELLVRDSTGERIVNVPVKGRTTIFTVPYGNISEIIPDPEVKLLFSLVK